MKIFSFFNRYKATSVDEQNTLEKIAEEGFYYGILIKKPANQVIIQDGYPVITIEGDTGRIVKFYGSIWRPGRDKWLDVKLDNKSYKHVHNTSVFVLYLHFSKIGDIPLSHACYRFIKPDDIHKVFKFRITKRGYAMFSEDIKRDREYIALLRRSRYGANFLSRLEHLGFNINKK